MVVIIKTLLQNPCNLQARLDECFKIVNRDKEQA